MFWTIAQYVFISIVFVIAVWYVFTMFKDAFAKKKNGSSCAKGCGCDEDKTKDKLH